MAGKMERQWQRQRADRTGQSTGQGQGMGLGSGNGRAGQRSRFWGFGKAYRIRAQQGKLGGTGGVSYTVGGAAAPPTLGSALETFCVVTHSFASF